MTPGIRPWIFAVALLGLTAQAADTSLAVTRRELPPEQNAYVLWAKAMPALELPDDRVLKDAHDRACSCKEKMPKGEGRQRLDAWLASKKEPLALVSQGIALGHFQFPPINPNDLKTSDLIGLRHIARLKIILAREHAERAEYEDAARELAETFKMGQLIVDGDGAMIHYLIGLAPQAMGLDGMRWLCAQKSMTQTALNQLLTALPAPSIQDPALAQVYQIEYAQFFIPVIYDFAKTAQQPDSHIPISISRVLDVKETVAIMPPFVARLSANALTSWPDRDRRIEEDAQKLVPPMEGVSDPFDVFGNLAMWNLDRDNPEKLAKWKRLEQLGQKHPNLLGRLYVSMVISGIEGSGHKHSVRARTDTNLTRAILALRIVQQETGRWPASLEACRALLPKPPLDLFAKPGTWVRYSPDRAILWSVGPDEIDNNGDPAKDVVLPLPKLAPAPAVPKPAPSAHSQMTHRVQPTSPTSSPLAWIIHEFGSPTATHVSSPGLDNPGVRNNPNPSCTL